LEAMKLGSAEVKTKVKGERPRSYEGGKFGSWEDIGREAIMRGSWINFSVEKFMKRSGADQNKKRLKSKQVQD